MPIYEYQCQACGDVQEIMQKMTDPAPTGCVVCHGGPINKLVSKTAFILKGTGWYVTDFRSKSKGTAGGEVPSMADVEATNKKDKQESSSSASASSSGAESANAPSSASAPAAASSPASPSKSPGTTST